MISLTGILQERVKGGKQRLADQRLIGDGIPGA